MGGQLSYADWLKTDLGELIDQLGLTDFEKHCVRSRWLDQVMWTEGRANASRQRHYSLRLIVIVGGALIPALVSLSVLNHDLVTNALPWLTVGVSAMVSISAAFEQVFRFGDRWRHFRQINELLKIEGWHFIQLGGPAYRRFSRHADAYRLFAERVENILRHDVDSYLLEVARVEEKEEPRAAEEGQPAAGGRGAAASTA